MLKTIYIIITMNFYILLYRFRRFFKKKQTGTEKVKGNAKIKTLNR